MRGSHQQTQTGPLPDYKGQGQQKFFFLKIFEWTALNLTSSDSILVYKSNIEGQKSLVHYITMVTLTIIHERCT